MKLESVFSAAGARNFFGEGWWFHKYYRMAFPGLFSFKGATFITKTTTLDSRMGSANDEEGNLSLNPKTLQPLEWFPKCVKLDFRRALGLNAVGLTGPGIGCRDNFAAIKIDIDQYVAAGANALDVGTVALVRPWFLQPTIRYARRTLNHVKVLDESEKERQQKRNENPPHPSFEKGGSRRGGEK